MYKLTDNIQKDLMVSCRRYFEVDPAAVHGAVSGYDVTYPQRWRRGGVPPRPTTQHVVRPVSRRPLYTAIVTEDKRKNESAYSNMLWVQYKLPSRVISTSTTCMISVL